MIIKRIFLILIIWGILFSTYSLDFNHYEHELVKVYANGTGKNQFRLNFPGIRGAVEVYGGPVGMGFTGETLMILDNWNHRIVLLDGKFDFMKTIVVKDQFRFGRIIKSGNIYINYSITPASSIGAYNESGDILFSFYNMTPDNLVFKDNHYRIESFVYNNSVLFVRDNKGQFYSILSPSNDPVKNKLNFKNAEQTRALFEKDSGSDPGKLSIDEENKFFLGGRIETIDFNTFFDYWNKKYDGDRKKLTKTGIVFNDKSAPHMTYMGTDKQNNYYWRFSVCIVVFSPEGQVLDNFYMPEMDNTILPAVHPAGDVYFLDHDQEKSYLYKIIKRW